MNYSPKSKSNLDLELQKEKTKQLKLIKKIKELDLYISKQNMYKKNNNMLEIFDKINKHTESDSDSDSDNESNSESNSESDHNSEINKIDTKIDINLDSISISSENSIDTYEEIEIKILHNL
jgi:hypothetical protein